MKGFSDFSRYEEMQGLGSWNQFLKISNYLKTSDINFSGTQSASVSTLNSVQAQNPVSAEADGECPQREPICSQHRTLGAHSGWTQPFWGFSSCHKRDELSPCSLGKQSEGGRRAEIFMLWNIYLSLFLSQLWRLTRYFQYTSPGLLNVLT